MEIIKGKHLGHFDLILAAERTCPECGVDHGCWPTWEDAMAHCEPDIQVFWCKQLRAPGVDIEDCGNAITPTDTEGRGER